MNFVEYFYLIVFSGRYYLRFRTAVFISDSEAN